MSSSCLNEEQEHKQVIKNNLIIDTQWSKWIELVLLSELLLLICLTSVATFIVKSKMKDCSSISSFTC